MPELSEIADAGVAAHERFVTENHVIDMMWMDGTLDAWLAEKAANERRDTTGNIAAPGQPA